MKWNKVLKEEGQVQKIVPVNNRADFMILLGGKLEIAVEDGVYDFIAKLTDGPQPIFHDFKKNFKNPIAVSGFRRLTQELIKRFKASNIEDMVDKKEFDYFENNLKKLVKTDEEMQQRISKLATGESGSSGAWDMFFQIGVYVPNEKIINKKKMDRILNKDDDNAEKGTYKLSFRRWDGNTFVDINEESGESE